MKKFVHVAIFLFKIQPGVHEARKFDLPMGQTKAGRGFNIHTFWHDNGILRIEEVQAAPISAEKSHCICVFKISLQKKVSQI